MIVTLSSTPVALEGTGEPGKLKRYRRVAPPGIGRAGMGLPVSSTPTWRTAPPSLGRVSTARKGVMSWRLPSPPPLVGVAVGVPGPVVAVGVALGRPPVGVAVAVAVGVAVGPILLTKASKPPRIALLIGPGLGDHREVGRGSIA